MKYTHILTIITLIAISSFMVYRTSQQKKTRATHIAFLQPASHPAMDEIYDGFIHTIHDYDPAIQITRFNGENNKTMLHAIVQDILADDYIAALTVGSAPTQMLYQSLRKHTGSMLHLFTAVSSLEPLQIKPDAWYRISGITSQPDYAQQLEHLIATIPAAQHLLLLYDPTQNPQLAVDAQTIPALAAKLGIKTTAIEIYNTQDITQNVQPYLQDVDAILILKDNTLVAGVDTLINLCNKHHVVLYASDLNSGIKGAALAYGVQEREYGVQAAQLLIDYLKTNTVPAITNITNESFVINQEALKKQSSVHE